MELTQTIEVGRGGKIVLTVPHLSKGQKVEVHIVSAQVPEIEKPRVFGSARGRGHMVDDFDAPFEDFRDYM